MIPDYTMLSTCPKCHTSKHGLNGDSEMRTDILPKVLPQTTGGILIVILFVFIGYGEPDNRQQPIFYLPGCGFLPGRGEVHTSLHRFSNSTLSTEFKLL
jgi:hypothetical protein